MKGARYGIAALLGLVVLVTANWWLNRVFAPPPPSPPVTDSRIDYALIDFTATFFDGGGTETLRISGPSLEHDAVTLEATIDSPRFTVEPDVRDWTGRAELGVVERDAQRLTLSGDVHLSGPHPRGRVDIQSERVVYQRRDNTARSPLPVRVEQGGDVLTGGSLELWIDEERLELYDDVHAIYRGAGAAAGG